MIRQARFGEIIAIQVLIAVMLSLVLDGGELLRIFLISLAAYWAAICVYFARHSSFSSRSLPLVRFGWILILPIVLIALGLASCLLR